MRESTRIVGLFGALGLGALGILLLASLASAQSVTVYTDTTGTGAQATTQMGTGRDVVVVTPGRVARTDPYARESALRAQVASNLAASRSLSGSNVLVTSRDGAIVLTGTVAETGDLGRAEWIARRTPGVANVINELTVQPIVVTRVIEPTSDAELARQVSERLASEFTGTDVDREWEYGYEVEGHDLNLDVSADDGEITVSGQVPSYDALGRVITVARSVPGVVAVRSNLRLDRGEVSAWQSYPGPFEKPQHHPFFGRSYYYHEHDYVD